MYAVNVNNINSNMICLLHDSLAVMLSSVCSNRLEINAQHENLR